MEEEGPKRTCSEANNEGFRPSLPDLVVRQLTFGPASCNGINTQLPQKAVQEIQEEAYRWALLKGMMSRNSDAYKNQALTIYHSPLDFKQQEEKEELEKKLKVAEGSLAAVKEEQDLDLSASVRERVAIDA